MSDQLQPTQMSDADILAAFKAGSLKTVPAPTIHALAAQNEDQQGQLDTLKDGHAESVKKLDVLSTISALSQTTLGKLVVGFISAWLLYQTAYYTGFVPPSPVVKSALDKLEKQQTDKPPMPPVNITIDKSLLAPPAKDLPKEENKIKPAISTGIDKDVAASVIAGAHWLVALHGTDADVACCGNQVALQDGKRKYGRGRIAPSAETVAKRAVETRAKHGAKLAALHASPSAGATAQKYDCRTLGQVGPIKDQGGCGDCYIFSGIGVSECSQFTAGVALATSGFGLSEQMALDCWNVGGCNGGDEWQVAQMVMSQGVASIAQYPGNGQNPGNCKNLPGAYKIAAMGYCDPNQQSNGVASTQLIKNCLVQYGPVSVAVAAGGNAWSNYNGGLLSGTDHNIDHAIIIVGWDDTQGSSGVWIARNSWSTQWGIQGYALVPYGNFDIGTEAFWVQTTPVTPPATAPVVTGPTTATAVIGTPFSQQIVASNSPTSYALSGQPAWLTVSAAGVMSGTPPAAGSFQVSMTATNSGGTSPAVVCALTVGTTPIPPNPGAVTNLQISNTLPAGNYEVVPAGTTATVQQAAAQLKNLADQLGKPGRLDKSDPDKKEPVPVPKSSRLDDLESRVGKLEGKVDKGFSDLGPVLMDIKKSIDALPKQSQAPWPKKSSASPQIDDGDRRDATAVFTGDPRWAAPVGEKLRQLAGSR